MLTVAVQSIKNALSYEYMTSETESAFEKLESYADQEPFLIMVSSGTDSASMLSSPEPWWLPSRLPPAASHHNGHKPMLLFARVSTLVLNAILGHKTKNISTHPTPPQTNFATSYNADLSHNSVLNFK